MVEGSVPRPVGASFTPESLAVFESASDEARALNHRIMGTEHVLLGLMRPASSHAARVLAAQVDVESVRAEVRQVLRPSRKVSGGDLPWTPRVRDVLRYARREADLYRMELIEPDHLLVGILREGEGVGMQVLLKLGADFWQIRAGITDRWQRAD